MRRAVILAGLAVAVVLAGLWATGGFDALARAAASAQREFLTAMARVLRSLRAGEAGAFSALIAVSFAYGVAHAAGPGHGKFLIGGYGVASRVRLLPLAGTALLSALVQATVAVLIVGAGLAIFNWTRDELELADLWLAPLSYALIGLLGLWVVRRGIAHARVSSAVKAGGTHGHPHGHGHAQGHSHGHYNARGHVHGPGCGHSHGPELEELARLGSVREAALLIAGVAVRPCTGALFILILTAQMGIFGAGIAGAYAMGLGTAVVTVLVAVAAVALREGALESLSGIGLAGRVVPVLEIAAGAVIAAIAAVLLVGAVQAAV